MNKKKIIALVIGLILIVAGVRFFLHSQKKLEKGEGYIFDKANTVPFEDIAKSRAMTLGGDAEAEGLTQTAGAGRAYTAGALAGMDIKKFFTEDGGVNPYTLKYFKFLEKLFKDSANIGAHLEEVKKFLYDNLPPEEAARYFDIYKKYLTCEMELAKEKQKWGWPKNVDEAIAILRQVQDYRREHMGAELADALFGSDVKVREYALRRGSIVGDKELYGVEKEEKLKSLTQDMWGADAGNVETYHKPYNRYQEKLKIYERDLSELPDDESKKAKVHEFREEFFEPEVVKRLDDVDVQVEHEARTETGFREKEKSIQDDPSLSAEEKDKKVQTLIDSTFGEEADAWRRREVMRKELEKRTAEHKK